MAKMTEERRRMAQSLERALRRRGFDGVTTTELSGAYTVDFQLGTTEPWQSRNLPSGIHVTEDGGLGSTALRPPGGPNDKGRLVHDAAKAAAEAAGRHWHFYTKEPEMGDAVVPHVNRPVEAPDVPARKLVDEITRAVQAYRRETGGTGLDLGF